MMTPGIRLITFTLAIAESNRTSGPYVGYQDERDAHVEALKQDLAILKTAHGIDGKVKSAIDSLAEIPSAYKLEEANRRDLDRLAASFLKGANQ